MIKRIIVLALIMTVIYSSTVLAQEKGLEITAKAAVIMEASTGKVLYAKNARKRSYPASTTKIMTLLVALDKGNLDDVVITSAHAAATEGSTLWLAPNEKLTLSDLLYGIMLVSGNDATIAVAEHLAGSVEKYAELMTQKAKEIGAKDTNFINPNGLPDDKHYSTAYDLALIAAYGFKNPLFAEIVSTRNKIIPWAGKSYGRDLYNENKLLWQYEGANGVKTGYTEAAGRCLVSAAKRDNVQLVVVVLDSDKMWEDSQALLDYGFSHISAQSILKSGDVLKTIRVLDGERDVVKAISASEVLVPLSDQDRNQFYFFLDAPQQVEAPIIAGQKIGTIRVFYKDKEINSIDLVTDTDIRRKSFFATVWQSVWSFFTFVMRNFA